MSNPSAHFVLGDSAIAEIAGEEAVRRAEAVRPAEAMRVTEIVEHHRRPGRFLVTLSDGRTLVLSVTLLADVGATRVGAVIPPEALVRLEREAEILAVVDRAVASLSRGRRTRKELEQRLARVVPGRVAPSAAVIAIALDRLAEAGVLSDTAAARAEASARLRRGDAPFRVVQVLQRKGIERTAAAAAVALAVTEESIDEVAQCAAVAAKRMRSLQKLEPQVARRRLTAFLVRRGYGSASIRSALAEHFQAR